MRGRRAVAEPGHEAATAAPNVIARLVTLDAGLFAFSIAGITRWPEIAPGLGVPAVHIASEDGTLEITDAAGEPGMWLGGPSATLLVRAPACGATALVTAYLGHDPAISPLTLTRTPTSRVASASKNAR